MLERASLERELHDLRDLRDLRDRAATRVDRQAPPLLVAGQVSRLGRYEIRSNTGATLPFWSLAPLPVIAAAPGHVLFDVLVEVSSDRITTANIAAPALVQQSPNVSRAGERSA